MIRTAYKAQCDFCDKAGPSRDTPHEATAAAKRESEGGIRIIWTSFYGNEVWSCALCAARNEMAREYAAATAEERSPLT